jgi:predicted aspartyl protease
MIKGVFVENIPLIRVVIAWGQAVQAPFMILDTGFTGDIQVTPKIAKELGLQVVGVTKSRIANGLIIDVQTALALSSMEGVVNYIQVLISESMPLAGIGFFTKFGYRAIIDCKHRTISLEKVNTLL